MSFFFFFHLTAILQAIRTFNRITHPSSFVVLVSGIVMIVKMGQDSVRPFWIQYMQDAEKAASSISRYSLGLLISLLFILSVVFMASFKFS